MRRRFSIAHEFGHFILHNHPGIHIDKGFFFRNKISEEVNNPNEIEANRFAAELLMPKNFIVQALQNYSKNFFEDDIIERLARDFKVSKAAMGFRLQNLGYLTGI